MTARDADTARKDAETAAGGAHPCSIESGMRILGGKWTGSILWHLQDRPVRFNELARMISGASKKMIADRLRLLEARGLITRRVLEGAPVAVEYELTPLGADALECLDALRRWTERLPPQMDETVD
ncbi:MAG: helix-turn-helix domain-containing protein [Pseudomonadota bacterium]